MHRIIISPFKGRLELGFSLVELMAVLASLAAVIGIGVIAVSKAKVASDAQKLETEQAVLNEAVRLYLANGGLISEEATGPIVLAALKTVVDPACAAAVVGVKGPFIDPRIQGILTNAGSGPRLVWSAADRRFQLAARGVGFAAFRLDPSTAIQAESSEARITAQRFSQHDSWVWDFDPNHRVFISTAPTNLDTGAASPPPFVSQTQAAPNRLSAPTFSRDGGLYNHSLYPMGVSLTNPNPAGTSVLYYSLNDGPWQLYVDGTSLALPRHQLDSWIRAYAAAIDSSHWQDSRGIESTYRTIFFRGSTAGHFTHPAGDAGLVSNLVADAVSPSFTWGTPSAGQPGPNALGFTGVAHFEAEPDQEFKLGELTYYNGTTQRGTNATSVELRVQLALEVPHGTEDIAFTLRLQSTPNHGLNDDDDADYVWIPTLASAFSTSIQGQTFYLQLRFGTSTSDGFTTIDEFHVHENKTAKGAIYGKLTTTPVF